MPSANMTWRLGIVSMRSVFQCRLTTFCVCFTGQLPSSALHNASFGECPQAAEDTTLGRPSLILSSQNSVKINSDQTLVQNRYLDITRSNRSRLPYASHLWCIQALHLSVCHSVHLSIRPSSIPSICPCVPPIRPPARPPVCLSVLSSPGDPLHRQPHSPSLALDRKLRRTKFAVLSMDVIRLSVEPPPYAAGCAIAHHMLPASECPFHPSIANSVEWPCLFGSHSMGPEHQPY